MIAFNYVVLKRHDYQFRRGHYWVEDSAHEARGEAMKRATAIPLNKWVPVVKVVQRCIATRLIWEKEIRKRPVRRP